MKEIVRPPPPRIKRYEALGSLADKRTKQENGAYHVYSSSGNKFYTVEYDATTHAIMTNDNGTFYKGYLGYPALCYLLEQGILPYRPQQAKLVQGIYRKQLNTDMNYNFEAVIDHIHETLPGDRELFKSYIDGLEKTFKALQLIPLGEKKTPPTGW